MKEADIRGEVFNLLERYHYWPMTQQNATVCPRCHTQWRPPASRPDIVTLQNVVVECKSYPRRGAFPFAAIEAGQRGWLDLASDDGIDAYLALGTRTGRAGTRNPRRLWIVPWSVWLAVEERVRPFQDSLPLMAGLAKLLAVRERGLGAVELLQQWALYWENGEWHLPLLHPLYTGEERDLAEWRERWKSTLGGAQ